MALTPEDLEALGSFIDSKLKSAFGEAEKVRAEDAEKSRDATVGIPDVDPDAGPEFYIHLADGSVVTSHDSSSTHLPDNDGTPVAVIGRYQKGK
jgi:hypothetical protein